MAATSGDRTVAAIAVSAEEVAGRTVNGSALLTAYLSALEDRWADVMAAGGRRTMADYRRRCLTLGRAVRAELPGGEVVEG
ncbi:MAG: hypothetical protein ABR511_10265, partial [Acidimicrobiales bacterium]